MDCAGTLLGFDPGRQLFGQRAQGGGIFQAVHEPLRNPRKPHLGADQGAGQDGARQVLAAAVDPDIRIEPAWKVAIVYGMPCAIYHQLPAAYYLAARFHNDFESALLHAVNGGGQNLARAILTGALVGAQVGLARIPERFVDGLEDAAALRALAEELAASIETE